MLFRLRTSLLCGSFTTLAAWTSSATTNDMLVSNLQRDRQLSTAAAAKCQTGIEAARCMQCSRPMHAHELCKLMAGA